MEKWKLLTEKKTGYKTEYAYKQYENITLIMGELNCK